MPRRKNRSTRAPIRPRKGLAANQDEKQFQDAVVKAILEATPDGILLVDADANIASVNRRFFDLWKIEAPVGDTRDAPVLSQVTTRVVDPEGFRARIDELYADPTLDDRTEIGLKDGRTLERHSTVLRGDRGQYLGRVWFFRDISNYKRQQTTLAELAHTDSLTGVANRRHFHARAERERMRAQRLREPLGVLIVDVDHFKRVNDAWGHAAGDVLLTALAAHLRSGLRQIDLLARLGGDEFGVILPGADLEGARATAERLRNSVEDLQVPFAGSTLRCTTTVGTAVLRDGERSVDDVLRRADEALYRAKEAGRNRVGSDA